MSDALLKWLKWIAAAMLVGGFITYCNDKNAEVKKRDKVQAAKCRDEESADIKRMHEWAYISKEKQITPEESLKLIILPGEFGDISDMKCLVYTNRELRQSTFTCPGASQDDVVDPNQRN
jgi:hypothetical protein